MSNDQISAALERHCRFLAYVRVNALLHDCDKSFADFLLWSLLPTKRRSEVINYNEHNKSTEPGEASLKREEYLQYWKNSVARTAEDLNDSISIPFPAPSCYASYFDQDKNGPFYIIQKNTIPCHSIYDFLVYHHDRPDCIERAGCSSSLFLFISGVAGIDGNDTGYESEMEAAVKGYSGHHTPEKRCHGDFPPRSCGKYNHAGKIMQDGPSRRVRPPCLTVQRAEIPRKHRAATGGRPYAIPS